MTVNDDDRGIVLSPNSLTVDEGDTTGATYTVALAVQPTEEVTVTVTGHSGTDLTLDKTTLTFTTSTWETAQTVTVKADQDDDGADDTVTLTHTASGGEYAGVEAGLSVTVDDDETPSLTQQEGPSDPGQSSTLCNSETAVDVGDVGNRGKELRDQDDHVGGHTPLLEAGHYLEGYISSCGDTDLFRMELVAGKYYRLDLRGSHSLDGTLYDPTILSLFDHVGRPVWYRMTDGKRPYHVDGGVDWFGSDDEVPEGATPGALGNSDGGQGYNARMYLMSFPEDTYYVWVSSPPYLGTYRVSLTEVSDDDSGVRSINVEDSANGTLDFRLDEDAFEVTLTAGATYGITVAPTGWWTGRYDRHNYPFVSKVEDVGASTERTFGPRRGTISFTPTTTGHHRFTVKGLDDSWYHFADGPYVLTVSRNLPATGPIVLRVVGGLRVGNPVSAHISEIRDDNGLTDPGYSYQWIVSDGATETEIPGGADGVYTLGMDDLDKFITVRVTFTDDDGYHESLSEAWGSERVSGLVAEFRDIPESHDGSASFNLRLAFSGGVINIGSEEFRDHALTVTGGSVTEAGRVDGSNDLWEVTIAPSTPGDLTVTLPGGRDCEVDGAICGSPSAILVNQPSVTIPGPDSVRPSNRNNTQTEQQQAQGPPPAPENLTAVANADGSITLSWDAPDDDSVTGYQILRRRAILDAEHFLGVYVENTLSTDTTYTDTEVTAETPYVYRVKAINSIGLSGRSNYVNVTPLEPGEPDENTPATGAPTITGTARVGETLTADTSGIGDENGLDNVSFSYQWIAEADGTDSDIAGATSSSYTLVAADAGKSIRVRVNFTDAASHQESLTSQPVGPVAPRTSQQRSNSIATGAPTITGTARVGETITVDTSGIADEDGLDNATFEPQWIRSDGTTDTDIAGATSTTYLVTTDDVDSLLKVRVSFTDDAGNDESLTSAATSAVSAKAPGAPGSVEVQPAGTGKLAVSWVEPASDGGAPVTGYTVQWKEAAGSWDSPADVSAATTTETSHTISRLSLGTEYSVRIIATNSVGDGPASAEKSATAVAQTLQQQAGTQNTPATGAPTISGTLEVGQTLSADISAIGDADGLGNVAFTYQWIRSDGTTDTGITGATGSTYTLVDADAGKAIKVRVSFTDDAGNEETLTSAPIGPDRPYGLTAAVSDGAVVLTWKPPVGQSYMFDYQILRNRPELGEAEPLVYVTYTETEETAYTDTDVGPGVLYVYRVKAVADVFGRLGEASEPVEIRTAEPTPGENSPATGAPTIGGTAQVGETLTVDTSGVADGDGLDNANFSYQWLADDVEINGADGSSYTLVAADEDKAIKVRVSFTDDEGNAEARTSAPTAAVAPPLTAQFLDTPPSHDGQTAFTFELRFSEEFDLSYVTLRDHVFTVTGGEVTEARRLDKPGNIRWEITVRPDGNGEVTVVLPATEDCEDQGAICTGDGRRLSNRVELTVTGPQGSVQNTPATGLPTISGTAQVGETQTADTSGISDEDGLDTASFNYQWLADDAEIQDATAATYTLVDAHEGKVIKVRVSFTDDEGTTEMLTSTATDPVAARPNSPATGTPAITGTPQVGETLTADTSGIADEDGLDNATFSYQWIAGGMDIAGATGSSYTLTADEEGATIQVWLSFTDDAGNPEAMTSAATDAVTAKPNSLATGAAVISGTAQVGETLVADTSGIADDDGLDNASFVYQWIAGGTHIQGATDSSYTLTAGEEGLTIHVWVSFTDDAGNEETLTSAATDAVSARPNTPATGQPTISGAAQVGETLSADTSGIADEDGLDNPTFSYQWLADDADIAGATNSTYTLTDSDEGKAIKVRVSFTDDEGNEETLTSAATSAVAAAPTMLTAQLLDTPSSHDGQTAFTFELRFSEEFDLSYVTLRDHAFTVAGGEVTEARRLDKPGNIRWEITVRPDSDGEVAVVLPATGDCEAEGAICTEDGRMLSSRLELIVRGPDQ